MGRNDNDHECRADKESKLPALKIKGTKIIDIIDSAVSGCNTRNPASAYSCGAFV